MVKNYICIIFSSIIITAIISFSGLKLSKEYFKNHTYFADASSYMYENINNYVKFKKTDSVIHILEQLPESRHPLRIASGILFPETLKNKWAHLTSTIPIIFLFILLLSIFTYVNFNNLYITIGISSLISSAGFFIDPFWGLSAYWLDLTSGLILASSAIGILLYYETKNKKWLLAFSILFSFCFLSRYIMIFYGAIIFIPILLYLFTIEYRAKKTKKEVVLKFTYNLILPGLILCSFSFFNNLNNVYEYYTENGYALGHNWKDCIYSFLFFLRDVVTWNQVIVLSVPLLLLISLSYTKSLNKILISVWLIISLPFFYFFILKAYNTPHTYLSLIPVIFIGSLNLISKSKRKKKHNTLIGCVLILVSLLNIRYCYNFFEKKSKNPSEIQAEEKFIHSEIANFIAKDKIVNYQLFFNEITDPISMEIFYSMNKIPKKTGNFYFSIHKSYFKSKFQSKDEKKVAKIILDKSREELSKIVTFHNTSSLDSFSWINNNYTKEVAKIMSDSIKEDVNWQLFKTIKTKRYSTLALYEKVK